MTALLVGLSVFLIAGTAGSLLSHDYWLVRIFDFPRKQLAVAILGVLTGFLMTGPSAAIDRVVMALLAACLVYQCSYILPYTALAPKQVRRASGTPDKAERIAILTVNVEIDNRDPGRVLELVSETDPDVLLVIETDRWWTEQLSSLHETYAYSLRHPRENAYGMCLYSKYPLFSPHVRFLVEEDIPSIHTRIVLPSGVHLWFHGMHPRPPHPRHDPDTTERDAELLTLARMVQDRDAPTIVTGDLNDVSWSYMTYLFQKISGLLDPRLGRGFYNTFHARYPFIRYPLDHTFHSEHFTLSQLRVLPHVGSDHFPVFAELQYDPEAPGRHTRTPETRERHEEQADYEMAKLAQKRNAD